MSGELKKQELYDMPDPDAKEVICIRDYNDSYGKLEKGKKYPVSKTEYDEELVVTSIDENGHSYIVNSLLELLIDKYVEVVG